MWVLIITCFPYIGIIFYLIFGNTVNIKFNSFIRFRRLKKLGKGNNRREIENSRNFDGDLIKTADISDRSKSVANFNLCYNGAVPTCYDNVDFFTSGKEHYKALFKDIKNAEKSIHIEFYTIHEDIVGKKLAQYLAKKAKEGVTVTVICDFLANIGNSRKMFSPIRENGGYVRRVKCSLTHFRSHRKIVTIDGKIAYIGGMNIGKQYADMGKIKNPWRDTQIRLTGSCVKVLENYVNTDTILTMNEKRFRKYNSFCPEIDLDENICPDKLCQFVTGGVSDNLESIKMSYLSMIRSAKSSIRIQSPYFVPDPSIFDSLKAACASGISIEIMLPQIKSSFFLEPLSDFYANELAEFGAKIYKYKGYIHAKTLVIDKDICCVGSVNLDYRSLIVDDEICGIFYNEGLAGEYSEIYDEDIQNSDVFDSVKFSQRSKKDKLKERFFMLFAPLM